MTQSRRLVAHLVIFTCAALVVLVVIFVLLHVVGVLVTHFLPVDGLAAGAAATGDDVGFGDGFQVVVDFLIVCGGMLVLYELGRYGCGESVEVSRRS